MIFTQSYEYPYPGNPHYQFGNAHISQNQFEIENLTIPSDLEKVFSVTTDVRNNMVYWTASEGKHAVIYRSVIKWPLSKKKQAFVTAGIYEPNGISYDWIGENIYIIDSKTRQIIVCPAIKATRCAVLLEDSSLPRKIALDPNRG